MLKYLIVGSGYRALYYGRIAQRYPDLFRASYLCRSEEKAALMHSETGARAYTSEADALAFRPDFIVVAVDRAHICEITLLWARRGYPVLCETPVASNPEQIRELRSLHETGAKIVCCEQYHRYPLLAFGMRLLEEGAIGIPVSAYLSLAHEYHGFSLIRRMLGTVKEPYTIRAERHTSTLLATDSRYGAITDGSTASETRDLAYITFASGKTAVYDFAPIQYRSFIRSRHLCVRGTRGEWCDTVIYGVDDCNRPVRTLLLPEISQRYTVLDTQNLRDARKTWQPELFLDTLQDEFAIASILFDMQDFLRDGTEPYPFSEAIDDAAFAIQLSKAIADPWTSFSGF